MSDSDFQYYDPYEYSDKRHTSFDLSYYAAQSSNPPQSSNEKKEEIIPKAYPLRSEVLAKKTPRNLESDSNISDGAFSIPSSLMRTPNGGYDTDYFGTLRSTQIDEGRYAAYAPSSESLIALLENKKQIKSGSQISHSGSILSGRHSHPYGDVPNHKYLLSSEPYPSWTDPHQLPLSKEEIHDIFLDLRNKFGFQEDNMTNMYDAFMVMLDSRASRMTPAQALLTLHADYLGGHNSNYRSWFYSAQMDKDSPFRWNKESEHINSTLDSWESFCENWREQMNQMSHYERVRQLALWLMIWGEASILRFCSENLCFIFKLAYDYLQSDKCQNSPPLPGGHFLDTTITPLYKFIREQGYNKIKDKWYKRERDHTDTIGYDDVNELFWSQEGLKRIVLSHQTKLMDIPPSDRFEHLKDVEWKKVFYKTYKERRTFFHLLLNFSRVWILHFVLFYYYTVWNAPFTYLSPEQMDILDGKNMTTKQHASDTRLDFIMPFKISLTALGGSLAAIVALIGTLSEFFFIPVTWNKFRILTWRLLLLFALVILNVAPFVVIYLDFTPKSPKRMFKSISKEKQTLIATGHFVASILTTLMLSIIPMGRLFNPKSKNRSKQGLTNYIFTCNYPELSAYDRALSIGMWVTILLCKFLESYFFLTLSFKDPFRAAWQTKITNCKDHIFDKLFCKHQATITVSFMLLLDLILFFLDTYLWYIICNTMFSIAKSFYLGISIWSPWRNIFARLPKRIYAKILATADMEIKYKPKVLCSQIWNAIVISMYREHLLSVDHVQKLLYQQVPSEENGKRSLKPPTFFVAQEDISYYAEFFPPYSEAERRISFFAQSLATQLPEAVPVENMPTFTVLTPHYSEKILLSLREIIRESDQYTRVTLLEYLKALHPIEWENFVKDTKILAEESAMPVGQQGLASLNPSVATDSALNKDSKLKADDLPLYSIGFKSAAPEFTLRTRIWASLRTQTLYRTISGFMNYAKAIKLLYRVENPELVSMLGGSSSQKLEQELNCMARRKFRFLVTMQRFSKFSKDEQECVNFLMSTYPDLKIAYLDEVEEDGKTVMYSCMIGGRSEIVDGVRKPTYRIKLPGNPILGDGKSDNQNHAIIFSRGEYLQLIDANQDNYLEEAIKVRNILGEFEEYEATDISPYSPAHEVKRSPVAIVGAREYIFSENIGVLGDIAAGKEQTFGTLTGRIMASIGGKLHYGHPDFLHSIFMNTRGGISKAQKGLHLNEDIYAGMNAFNRGGRIKHTEYYQCGKGRDLGFGSVLQFFTKIGSGMGEQMLSREQYYLGTQLPFDRFMTFYYAHPGFHVNNIFIMLSVSLFMFCMVCFGTIASSMSVCEWNDDPNAALLPLGCFNIHPLRSWVQRTIMSIFLVLFIAYLPLFLQVLTEQGFIRCVTRLGKQFLSFSPLFEVFVTQTYANSLLTNLSFGGARYIATGRGFATTRISFPVLLSRFSTTSIYFGMKLMLMLLFASVTIWVPELAYFWCTILALSIAPFIFNPHQFCLADFILDYKKFLTWLSVGNAYSKAESWITHARQARIKITGYKKKRLGEGGNKLGGHVPRAQKSVILMSELILPLFAAMLLAILYGFTSTMIDEGYPDNRKYSGITRIVIVSLVPVLINASSLFVFFLVSLFMGPPMSVCLPGFGSVIAGIVHTISVVVHVVCFLLLWALDNWSVSRGVLSIVAMVAIQRAIIGLLISVSLSREFGADETNIAWWTGKWYGKGLGLSAMSQPLREYVCKIVECSIFAGDFLMAHLILFFLAPICLIPYINKWHSMMLFWLRPSRQIRPPIYSTKKKRERRTTCLFYGALFILVLFVFLVICLFPRFMPTPAKNIRKIVMKIIPSANGLLKAK